MIRTVNIGHEGQSGFAGGAFAVVLLFLATVAAIAWVSMGIVTSERWPIRWLEINGTFNRVSAEQLRASLSSEVGSSFFTLDLQGLQEAGSNVVFCENGENVADDCTLHAF